MAFKWWDMWQKGIRVKSLKQLLLLMAKYCYGHENVAFIDFHSRYSHRGKTLNTIDNVVKLFIENEMMSKRTAYDYARAIERIQFLTR